MGIHSLETYIQNNIKDGIINVNLKHEIEDFQK
jgi:hypothetical protein